MKDHIFAKAAYINKIKAQFVPPPPKPAPRAGSPSSRSADDPLDLARPLRGKASHDHETTDGRTKLPKVQRPRRQQTDIAYKLKEFISKQPGYFFLKNLTNVSTFMAFLFCKKRQRIVSENSIEFYKAVPEAKAVILWDGRKDPGMSAFNRFVKKFPHLFILERDPDSGKQKDHIITLLKDGVWSMEWEVANQLVEVITL